MKNGMRAIHPGELLLEEHIKPLNMTTEELAVYLNVDAKLVDDVVCGKESVLKIVNELAAYFKTTKEFWMNMQSIYDRKKGNV
jgi:antitoxin HigA-1